MKRVSTVLLLIVASAAGCDGEPPPSGASGTSPAKPGATAAPTGSAGAAAAASAPDFSPWDLAAIRRAISGTYVFKFNGSYQAWDLRDGEATLFGDVLGKEGEDIPATIEMIAPCRIKVKTGDAKTGWRSSIHQLTVKDGFFPGGSSGIGMKKGDEIVYCEGTGTVYRSGKDGCSMWEHDMGKWSRSEAKCGLRDHEGKPAFWTDLSSTEPMYRIEIDGEALFPGATTHTPPHKVPDMAAAKAKVAELKKGG